jgi:hypothetical protein
MARIQLGSHVNSISGKLSGDFFQKGRNYTSIKKKSISKKSISLKSGVASLRPYILSTIQTAWRTMPSATKNQWQQTNINGLSGYNLFCKVNMFSNRVAPSLVVPTFKFAIIPVSFSWSYTPSPLSLSLTCTGAVTSNQILFCYISEGYNASCNVKKPSFFKGSNITNASKVKDITAQYLAKKKYPLRRGQKVYIKLMWSLASDVSFGNSWIIEYTLS